MAAAMIACLGLGVLISCSKSGDKNVAPGGGSNNDKDTVMASFGASVIVPAYQNLATSTAALDAAATAFNSTPDADHLATLKAAFQAAYLSYEHCTQFEFGPATQQSMVTTIINVFPTDVNTVKGNMATGNFTIDGLSNFKAQGFPALDYMLYGDTQAQVLATFSTAPNAANARKYLAAVTASLKTKAATVLTAWQASGGNYLKTFGDATGVDAGSSLSVLVNSFVYDYDVILKNYKLGIPIGKYGASTLPQDPAKVEAYYSGASLALLNTELLSVQQVYLKAFSAKVIASKAQANGVSLDDAVKAQLTTVINKVKALPDPLSGAVVSANAAVNDAYTEVSKLVVLVKVDMSAALGVKISFSDDDGD